MKEILTSQCDLVSGGWHDQDGSGRKSATNGGSRALGSTGNSGNSGNRGLQSFLSTNSPYGSGSSASGFWGNSSGGMTGYSGNGTGPRRGEVMGHNR